MTENKLRLSGTPKIDATENDYNAFKAQVGDFLIVRSGTVGTYGIVYEEIPAIFGSYLIDFRFDHDEVTNEFFGYFYQSDLFKNQLRQIIQQSANTNINAENIKSTVIQLPNINEQKEIGVLFEKLDNVITLHQCEPKNKMEDNKMLDNINNQILFCDYYEKWIKVYKEGAIRKVTLEKYYMTHRWLKKLIPELKICEMTRINYQQLLNDYALYHERQTTMDFHHQLKGAILDAVDEGLLDRDPTRKAIIKGKTPAAKKIKYINQFELHTLLNNLNLKSEISWDWFILIVAKTGLRFSEALALTPKILILEDNLFL